MIATLNYEKAVFISDIHSKVPNNTEGLEKGCSGPKILSNAIKERKGSEEQRKFV